MPHPRSYLFALTDGGGTVPPSSGGPSARGAGAPGAGAGGNRVGEKDFMADDQKRQSSVTFTGDI